MARMDRGEDGSPQSDLRAIESTETAEWVGCGVRAGAAMSDVTVILAAIEHGDQEAASKLLPLLYDELRKLAAQKLAGELPGQTLEPTSLVHEAYLRLVASDPEKRWDGRGHFFAAAAEAMRRILVENARKKARKSAAATSIDRNSIPRRFACRNATWT